MKGGGVSQKHIAVGQRGEQIAFKAVCFSDRSGRGGGERGKDYPSGKLYMMFSYFTILFQ